MKRNKLDFIEVIVYLVKNGKNNMLVYKDCLIEIEIEIVLGYVL